MSKYIKLLMIILLITGCKNEKLKIENKTKVNEIFKNDAKNIFGSNLKNERENSSYSSYSVTYKINHNVLNLSDFNDLKTNKIVEIGWFFKEKREQSYIFCKDGNQLEIVPPRKLVGNEKLTDGDRAAQLEDQWNIMLYRVKTNRRIACSN